MASSQALANTKKPSPTPSIKRGKAERLLKEHGSPPGMRVTAGGRVVPSDLQPLSSARYTTIKPQTQAPRFMDPDPAVAALMQPEVNSLTPQVTLYGNQAVLRIGDRMFALPHINVNNTLPPQYTMPSAVPSLPEIVKQPAEVVKQPPFTGVPLITQRSNNTLAPVMNIDVAALEAQHSQKKLELRNVEQTEVLEADRQGPVWRNGMIAKKRSLILEIDGLRKQLDAAKLSDAKMNESRGQPMGLAGMAAPATVPPPSFIPPFQAPLAPTPYSGVPIGMSNTTPYQPMMMYPPYGGPASVTAEVTPFARDAQLFVPSENTVSSSHFPTTFAPTATTFTPAATTFTPAATTFNPATAAPRSPGSATRRSHAVPIKKPQDDVKNPSSGNGLGPHEHRVLGSATVRKDEPAQPMFAAPNAANEKKQTIQGSTLDPKSPTYQPMVNPTPSKIAIPPTPSPAKRSPWRSNEVHSIRSDRHGNRALSQKPSLSSIDTTDFFPTNTHEHSSTRMAPEMNSSHQNAVAAPATPEKQWPVGPWNPPSDGQSRKLTSWPEAFGKPSSLATGYSKAAQHSSADPSRGSVERRPSHQPCTYQEGYQAGLGHLGLPNDMDVLRGFLDGLQVCLQEKSDRRAVERFLRDPNGNSSARSSIRGHFSGATLYDSSATLAENVRSAKANDIARFHESQNQLSAKGLGSIIYRPSVGMTLSKDELAHAFFPAPNSALSRQVSGNQVGGNRETHGTPLSMQRYYPIPQEYKPSLFTEDVPRPTHQRVSGFDGALDDLGDLVISDNDGEDGRDNGKDNGGDIGRDNGREVDASSMSDSRSAQASCFKSSTSNKGKQKANSPTKSGSTTVKDPSSPAKHSGPSSPAKAKLESVTNKLRRPKKDDPRTMSPEEKHSRTEKWRSRFAHMRYNEKKEAQDNNYVYVNPRSDGS
jgi:hypothetical protein